MKSNDIDRTHIIALQEKNGLLQKVELPITRPEQSIAELKAMIENPNRTVWDMQSLFTACFTNASLYLDYIHPYSYQASYVNGIRYPKLFEYSELCRLWAEAGDATRKSYLASCEQHGQNPDTSTAEQMVKAAIDNLKKQQKSNFLGDALHWIDASCYYEVVHRLNRDSSVKMFSKENIGWSNFIHRINDDINVALKTNFGFGSAAYFLLAVQYKGLDILPYSHIVKYYKANMADIIRCTRSYIPCRDSWLASFDFLSDFVNNSIANPDEFVKSYIMREVTEMMQGLEEIATNPQGVIERIGRKASDPCVINVRPMLSEDKIRMQSYPDETPILFKVEKIIGALDFLESLTAIAKEVSMVQPHINRLLEINMALYPEIQNAVVKIGKKKEEQTSIKMDIDTKISALSEKLAPFEAEIEKLRSETTKEKPFSLNDYEVKHHDYVMIKSEKNDLQSRLYKINRLISDFDSFLNMLDRSLSKLDEVKPIKKAA